MKKKISTGLFFEKGARPAAGHFFRDLPGRDNATFHEKTAMMGMAQPPTGGSANVSPPMFGAGEGAPSSSESESSKSKPASTPPQAQSGEETGGGMYGTGKPSSKSDASRLKALLAKAGPGTTRSAVKVAAPAPSDWDSDASLPTGFHRPARSQPEALESGGERFFATDAKSADHGSGASRTHGLVEGGGMSMRATSNHQMGKHASARETPPRFLGTSFSKEASAVDDLSETGSRRLEDYKGSMGKAYDTAKSHLGEGVKSLSQSPWGAALATLVAGKVGLGALKSGGRGLARLAGRKPKVQQGMLGSALGGLRRLVTGK